MVNLPQKTVSKNHSVLTVLSQREAQVIEIKTSPGFLNKGNITLPRSTTLHSICNFALLGTVSRGMSSYLSLVHQSDF